MAAAFELPAVQLKVTAALKAAVANARHISVRQVVPALSALTSAQVSPPPVTEVIGDVVLGIEMEAIKSSLGPAVVSVPVASVRTEEDPPLTTTETSKATGILSHFDGCSKRRKNRLLGTIKGECISGTGSHGAVNGRSVTLCGSGRQWSKGVIGNSD
jgi:hypothetical protein